MHPEEQNTGNKLLISHYHMPALRNYVCDHVASPPYRRMHTFIPHSDV